MCDKGGFYVIVNDNSQLFSNSSRTDVTHLQIKALKAMNKYNQRFTTWRYIK